MSASQPTILYPSVTDSSLHQDHVHEHGQIQSDASSGLGASPAPGNVSQQQQCPRQLSPADSVHSNQNLIISRDIEGAPRTRSEMDHLKKTLGPILVAALSEVCLRRPTDPIEYLAHWLLHYRYNEDHKRQEVESAVEAVSEIEVIKAQRLGSATSELRLESEGEDYGYGQPYPFGEFEGEDQRENELKMLHSMPSDESQGATATEEEDEYETVDHTGEEEEIASAVQSTQQSADKSEPPRERGLGTLMEMKPFIQTIYSKPK